MFMLTDNLPDEYLNQLVFVFDCTPRQEYGKLGYVRRKIAKLSRSQIQCRNELLFCSSRTILTLEFPEWRKWPIYDPLEIILYIGEAVVLEFPVILCKMCGQSGLLPPIMYNFLYLLLSLLWYRSHIWSWVVLVLKNSKYDGRDTVECTQRFPIRTLDTTINGPRGIIRNELIRSSLRPLDWPCAFEKERRESCARLGKKKEISRNRRKPMLIHSQRNIDCYSTVCKLINVIPLLLQQVASKMRNRFYTVHSWFT